VVSFEEGQDFVGADMVEQAEPFVGVDMLDRAEVFAEQDLSGSRKCFDLCVALHGSVVCGVTTRST
jgi:hypothetical protein